MPIPATVVVQNKKLLGTAYQDHQQPQRRFYFPKQLIGWLDSTVGVFLGVQFTNQSTGQVQQQQYYPASQSIASGSKIFAVVADDPDTLFQVVSCSATTTVAGMGISAIGNNIALIQNAGSTVTGNSKVAIDEGTQTTTNTLPIRIIDVVRETATGADTFVEFIVKINATMHQYNNSTGV